MANANNGPVVYILTIVNDIGYTDKEVFASTNIDNVFIVMAGMIQIKYQDDPKLINGLLDQFYTNIDRPELPREIRPEVLDVLQENRYYSLSGPDETPFEIAVQRDEQRIVNFYRQVEPQNMGNNANNANNFNENENRAYWERRREEMNENDYIRYEANLAMGMRGGKRKVHKTRKAKKSKKSKKTRRH